MGRATEDYTVVTVYEPPRRAALKGLSRNAPFDIKLAFEPIDGGTRVDVESTFNLSGVMRLIGPLFIGRYERGWDRGLAKLNGMMEAGEL
jgi:hypothetical protein